MGKYQSLWKANDIMSIQWPFCSKAYKESVCQTILSPHFVQAVQQGSITLLKAETQKHSFLHHRLHMLTNHLQNFAVNWFSS